MFYRWGWENAQACRDLLRYLRKPKQIYLLCCTLLKIQAFTTDPRDRNPWISKITWDTSLGTFRHLPAQHSPMWTPLQALLCYSTRSRLSLHPHPDVPLGMSLVPTSLQVPHSGAKDPSCPWCCPMAMVTSLLDFSKSGVWSTAITMFRRARGLHVQFLSSVADPTSSL